LSSLRSVALAVGVLLLTAVAVQAAEIRVMTSGALSAARWELTPAFERAAGDRIAQPQQRQASIACLPSPVCAATASATSGMELVARPKPPALVVDMIGFLWRP
jgi:hypothetical protein